MAYSVVMLVLEYNVLDHGRVCGLYDVVIGLRDDSIMSHWREMPCSPVYRVNDVE